MFVFFKPNPAFYTTIPNAEAFSIEATPINLASTEPPVD
jgi:hypothetical protein